MEKVDIRELATESVVHHIEERGVPKTWFQEKLGIAYNTLSDRLKNNSWTNAEILALKQLSILK